MTSQSYERSYQATIEAQVLAELEEVIQSVFRAARGRQSIADGKRDYELCKWSYFKYLYASEDKQGAFEKLNAF